MKDHIKNKLADLPDRPGIYFYKNNKGKIIYIGKASVLKNRVRQYFQNGPKDPKTTILVGEIADLEWMTVGSEVEALFLESEMIKRYRPMYNVDLKDDKHWNYVRITTRDDYPVVSFVRRPMDDGSTYFGPYTSGDAMKRSLKMLRRAFPYVTHATLPPRACLQAHLGLCPNVEEGKISPADYKRAHIRPLMAYLSGQGGKIMAGIEKDMHKAAKLHDYEAAMHLRNQLRDLQALSQQMIFGDAELFDLSRDQALMGLTERLQLRGIPRRIEAYDISHLSGTDNVASMVVFTDGISNRDEYRRFKMRLSGNNDFAHMREVIQRRFSDKNLAEWPKPDLLLIDGGKGQLAAALAVLDEKGIAIPAIGLAKREEEIIRRRPKPAAGAGAAPANVPIKGHWQDEAWVVANQDFETILLPPSSHVLQLLQRVRDEAHRFAVTYQSVLRGKRQIKSLLDDIPGVGPATRKLLVKQFGSVRGVKAASLAEVAAVIGPAKAKVVKAQLGTEPGAAKPQPDGVKQAK